MEPIKEPSLQPHPPRETVKPELPRDPYAGFDLSPDRRPGYAGYRPVEPWPNSRWPITPMPRRPDVFMHGRPNKQFPPVYGTDCPARGLSGALRKLAFGYPDHMARHWLMLLGADRVDSFEYHTKKLAPFAAPLVALALIGREVFKRL